METKGLKSQFEKKDDRQEFNNTSLRLYAGELRKIFSLDGEVLLVQAPQFLFQSINLDIIRNRGYYAYPPTGLQWLAKSLAGRGLKVAILDLNYLLLKRIIEDPVFDSGNWLEILDSYLEDHNVSIIGVSCLTVFTDIFDPGHPLTRILDHLKKKEKYILLAGGQTVSNGIRGYLQRRLCHFIIEGEGEDRINYLFDILFNKQVSSPPVKGIHFMYNDSPCNTSGKEQGVKLKGNLLDTFRIVPVELYNEAGSLNPYSRMAGPGTRYYVFQLNRGCRWNCKFCGVRPFMGPGIRTASIDDLIEEISFVVERHGVRHLEALDDDLLADKKAAEELFKGLCKLRKDFEITWSANNGLVAASIDEKMLELMTGSGCLGFKIGIESGSQEMLKKMHKPGNIKMFERTARMIHNHPALFVGGNYIIGLFGKETFGQMLETFRLSCRLAFDWSSFTLFQFTNNRNSGLNNFRGGGATDFIPAKDTASREFDENLSIPLGMEIFDLPRESVPSRKILKNIWFTFNLLGNYVNNPNLRTGGNPAQFLSWLEAVHMAYPGNPYMYLFKAIGNVLLERYDKAHEQLSKCKAIVNTSENWQYRLDKFDLLKLMHNFPISPREMYKLLNTIQNKFKLDNFDNNSS